MISPGVNSRGGTRRESVVALTVLVLLGAIAAAVFLKQFRYDPGVFQMSLAQAGGAVAAAPSAAHDPDATSGLSDLPPQDYAAMTAMETFGGEDLSQKIDGKAELYLGAGFVKLECQRFLHVGDKGDLWLEVFVYDMGSPANAFSVYSLQRRPDAKDSEAAALAYTAGNAMFFVHGKFYAEIVAAQEDESLLKALDAICRKFVQTRAAGDASLGGLELLPKEGQIRGAVKLMLKDAFSFDKLDNVVSVDYNIQGTTTTAFISLRESPEAASQLSAAYYEFVTNDLGGEAVETSSPVSNLKAANLIGDIEMVFSVGKAIAGVHAAKNRDAAEALALRLAQALEGRVK